VKRCALFFFCFLTIGSYSQQRDSTFVNDSTFSYIEDGGDTDESYVHGSSDSAEVSLRRVNEAILNELKSDSDLQYKEPPTIAESLWSRFFKVIGQFLEELFQTAVQTSWGNFLSYLLGLIVIVAIIMMILKVNAFQIFYSGQGAGTMSKHVLDENIHEMDFEKLIDEAVTKKDFRKAIRLLFLQALKLLSDRHFIRWDQSKTNHDYIAELKADDLKKGFHELNFYFEYAWYGNFSINDEIFSKVQNTFLAWKAKVK
jgi:hypothetical protein